MQNGELAFPNATGWNSISWYFFSQNQKCWFILFQYFNVYHGAKFGDLKQTIYVKPIKFGHVSEQGAETTFL